MITFIKKKEKKIAFLLSFIILFISCSKDNLVQNELGEESFNKLSKFSGEDIFNGVFFYEGEVAKIFPTTHGQTVIKAKLNSDILKKLHKVQSDIIDVFKAEDPEYFVNFKNIITSGDHLRIRDQLMQSSMDARKVTAKLHNLDISKRMTAENLANKLYINSRINSIKNDDGSINIDKLNAINYANKESFEVQAEEEACVAVVILIFLLWVYEHNRAETVTGNSFILKSNFESESFVNEIVEYSK
ncbi:hypothetical protein [Sinomicrobium sp. M5D2P17]